MNSATWISWYWICEMISAMLTAILNYVICTVRYEFLRYEIYDMKSAIGDLCGMHQFCGMRHEFWYMISTIRVLCYGLCDVSSAMWYMSSVILTLRYKLCDRGPLRYVLILMYVVWVKIFAFCDTRPVIWVVWCEFCDIVYELSAIWTLRYKLCDSYFCDINSAIWILRHELCDMN